MALTCPTRHKIKVLEVQLSLFLHTNLSGSCIILEGEHGCVAAAQY